jgi:uncharacterized protein YcsI (UPF0317 family)
MTAEQSPAQLRRAFALGTAAGNTSGLAPGFLQCNLVVLPAQYAADFHRFCQRNPKPCPVIAIGEPGSPALPTLGDIDIRSDLPAYRLFRDGVCEDTVDNVVNLWRDDFVSFALGCSFSFEEALLRDGLEVRNLTEGVNVPMYTTNIDCEPAGPFRGKLVVSMRPFRAADAIRAIQICTRFPAVHGAPIHLGTPSDIGIDNLAAPDFGDPVSVAEGEIPLFWACGVTPQVAMEQARLPIAITHSPGCMLITDIPNTTLALC